MKFLIIDGHNLLFQMFFGMPSRIIGKDGRAIHATLGFVGALIKMIRWVEPTHIVALFDGEHDKARTEISAEYKANRTGYADVPEEDNPFAQLADIYAALDHMGICHAETADCEADDAIAAYAFAYSGETPIVIASLDSDFFQLIGANVNVLRYRGDKTTLCDEAFIRDKFGISPMQYADFKALTGDACDNIRGAEKIGPKTAAALLRQFGGLEGILENAHSIGKPSIRESVKQNAKRLRMNYRLIKLDDKAPIPFSPNKLRYEYGGIAANEVLKEIGIR